jgi:hypothetical protein
MNPATRPSVVKPPRPLDQNRRRGNRHLLNIPANLLPDGESPIAIEVIITEISIAGVGLQCKQSLPLDRVYQLTSFDTLVPPGMRVKIVSQQPAANGEFKVGAQTI